MIYICSNLDLDLDQGLSVLVLHIKDSFVNESASISILYFNAISNFTPQRIFDNDTLPSKHVQNRKLQKRCTRRSSNCKENESTFRIKLKINIILLHLMKENNDHTSRSSCMASLSLLKSNLYLLFFSFFFFAKIDRPHTVVIQYVFSQ